MSRRNRFVSTETVRLELSDSDWIEVKERLSYAEAQALGSASIVGTKLGGGFELDMGRFNLRRLQTWIVDWNFADADGKSVPLSNDAIRNLDPDTAEEILAALNAYETERDADPNDKMIAESPSNGKS